MTSNLSSSDNATITSLRTCECRCRKATDMSNLTESELAEKVQKIKSELTVKKSHLSATTRKKTSAKDERTTAKATGSLGIVMLVLAIAVPVIMDSDRAIRSLKSWRVKGEAASQNKQDTSSTQQPE